MDPARWRRIEDILDRAFDLEPAALDALLRDACGGDEALRSDVEALLDAEARAPAFLDGTAAAFATPALEPLPEDASLPDSLRLRPGERIGRYRIVEPIGQGGMGIVCRAHDEQLRRDVALKFLRPLAGLETPAKMRFVREARAAARLDHPNVATIHEIDETPQGHLYIAMAYYPGDSLAGLLAGGPQAPARAMALALQVARGLAAAHAKGIVHRDIKPANLLLADDGTVKIADFGIAKLAQPDAAETRPALGTVAYMSPEQALGRDVDHRTDLWSLGVVLHEMLTGSQPFGGATPWLTADAILNRDPPPLDTPAQAVSPALERLVLRLLAKDVESRYESADAVATDLEAMLHHDAASAPSRGLAAGLPSTATSFVGRDGAVREVADLLAAHRLVTLTGAGGTGKTRLALEVARVVAPRYDSGAAFVTLAPVADPALVPSVVSHAFGLGDAGAVPPATRLADRLRDAHGLLVLDNFEHLLDAAPFVSRLSAACPRLALLVTSRAPLAVDGERVYPLLPLDLPGPAAATAAEAARSEAVRLFVDRAAATAAAFSLTDENAGEVSEVCRRLDGLPLAIELAAARLTVLTPAEIASRLEHSLDLLTSGRRDAPPRHRTLREAIAWSYELLTEERQAVFRSLSVFSGGITLESAEAMCRRSRGDGVDVVDAVQSLVENSLLQRERHPDGGERWRFRMLETIREFGLDRLRAAGTENDERRAHREVFLPFVETAARQLTGSDQAAWIRRLDEEHDNIRAALDSAVEHDPEAALRFGAALWRFWLVRGHLTEGAARLATLLDCAPASTSPASAGVRAAVLEGAGTLAHNRGHYTDARRFYEEALSLCRAANDEAGLARALTNLAWVRWRLAEYDEARRLAGEALSLLRRRDDPRGAAQALNNVAWADHYQGRYDRARDRLAEALRLQREHGDQRSIAFALSNLGWTLASLGQRSDAAGMLEEALSAFAQLGDRQLMAFTQARLGAVLHELGDADRAVALLRDQALSTFRAIGDSWGTAFTLDHLATALLDSDAAAPPGRVRNLLEESLALRRESGDRWGEARALALLGRLARVEGRVADSRRFYRESLALRRAIGDQPGIAECETALAADSPTRR